MIEEVTMSGVVIQACSQAFQTPGRCFWCLSLASSFIVRPKVLTKSFKNSLACFETNTQ